MQRDENLVTIRPGRSTPADSVYWRLLQTGRRSDPELESILTLAVLIDMSGRLLPLRC